MTSKLLYFAAGLLLGCGATLYCTPKPQPVILPMKHVAAQPAVFTCPKTVSEWYRQCRKSEKP